MVQPAMAAADRLGSPAGRRRRGPGLVERTRCRAVHRSLPRDADHSGIPSRAAVVAGCAALSQRLLHDFHHPGRPADPGRSRAAVLDEAFNPGSGLVPLPEARAGRPAVDAEAGFGQPAWLDRLARTAAFNRAGPMVAPRHRRIVVAKRRRVLRLALLHRPVAPDRALRHGRCSPAV